MPSRWLLPVLLAAVLSGTAPRSSSQIPIGGSYRLLVCRDTCGHRDSTLAYVKGTLVFSDSSFDLRSVPTAAREHMEFSYMFMGNAGTSDTRPNGCFILSPLKKVADSYLGIESVGLLKWQRGTTGIIYFDLFRSPDAGYHVVLDAATSQFTGSGESWGAGAAEIHAPSDSVIAWRLGPANLNPCFQAAARVKRDSA